jgi:drug/metabolite transporter (DMT)-like permease
LGQGLGAVVSRKAYEIANGAGQPIDGITAAYQRILGGVLVAFIFFLFWNKSAAEENESFSENTSIPSTKWQKALPWVVLNALAGPAIGVSCYQWALSTTPSGIILPIVATAPLVILPFSYWIEGDRPGIRSMVGGSIAVIGAVMLSRFS